MRKLTFKSFLYEMISYHDTVHTATDKEDKKAQEKDESETPADPLETKEEEAETCEKKETPKAPLIKMKYHPTNLRKYLQYNNVTQ